MQILGWTAPPLNRYFEGIAGHGSLRVNKRAAHENPTPVCFPFSAEAR
jgi:hypothetical protein